MSPPDDGPRDMATILMSLGVAPVNFKMAELFCRNRFGHAAAAMGFERTRGGVCYRLGHGGRGTDVRGGATCHGRRTRVVDWFHVPLF